MASQAPTYGEVQTQIKAYVDILEDLRVNATATLDLLGLIDTAEQLAEGNQIIGYIRGLQAIRRGYASALNSSAVKGGMDALLRQMGKARSFPERDPRAILVRLYRYMHDNSEHVQERAFAYGSPSAVGGGTGDGTLQRLNIDADGHEIEIGLAESFTAECIRDQGQTGIHEEVFELRTINRSPDWLENLGTGLSGQITAASARNSVLRNASFTSGVSATSIVDWTVTAGLVGNSAKNTTTTYRSAGPGDTATSLALTGAITLQQKINDKGIKLRTDVPYMCQLAYNRSVGTGNGTLQIAMGAATSAAVTLSGAGAGWNVTRIVLNAANSWWKGYKENDLDFTVALTAGEAISGTTYIDDFIVTPMVPFRGQFYSLVGGATPFLLRDQFTWADTIASDSKLQYWIYRLYGLYLPHTTAANPPSWTDP